MIALVVDTSVARSASGREGAGHPSPACTEAMRVIRDLGGKKPIFFAVTSHELHEEWARHATEFALRWRADMRSRGRLKRVRPVWPPTNDVRVAARERFSDGRYEAVAKDLPIVELAMATGQRVISEDARQRKLLAQLVSDVPQLGALCWVGAGKGGAAEWLTRGAPADMCVAASEG